MSNETRALLLTSFVKLANLYSDLIPTVKAFLSQHTDELDPELQKRVVEYLALFKRNDVQLLAAVSDHRRSVVVCLNFLFEK